MTSLRACLPLLLVACGGITKPPADTDGPVDDTDVLVDSDGGDTAWPADDTDGPDDTAVPPPPEAPTCSIVAPRAGVTLEPSQRVDLEAKVDDPDGDTTALDVTFTSDVDGELATPTPGPLGRATASTRWLTVGEHVISLDVVDPGGLSCHAEVVVQVGAAPNVAFTAPADGAVVAAGTTVAFAGDATDVGTAAVDLELVLTSDVDGVLAVGPGLRGGGFAFDVDGLSRGDHVVTVQVTDGDGLEAEDSVVVHVDGVPSAPVVTIAPAEPRTDDALVASITTPSVDPEGAPVTYTWRWLVDGVATPYTTSVSPEATTAGQTWRVEVTPSDGDFEGEPGWAEVVIGDTPGEATLDEIRIRALEPDGTTFAVGRTDVPFWAHHTVQVEADVTATDLDGDPARQQIEWFADATGGGMPLWTLIAGADQPPLPPNMYGKGFRYQARVRVVDWTATPLTPWRTATAVCLGHRPTEPVAATAPADPVAGQDDLVCTLAVPSTDADWMDVLTYAVAWTVDGAPAPAEALADGALDGDTVLAAATSAGQVWSCTITATDGLATTPSAPVEVAIGAP